MREDGVRCGKDVKTEMKGYDEGCGWKVFGDEENLKVGSERRKLF
jgi:hypothetical protein